MDIESNKKESLDILNDLNLVFKYLNSNDGKYLCFIKTTLVDNENEKVFEGFTGIYNLVPSEILEVHNAFLLYIEKSISKCQCEKCIAASKELKNILDKFKK
jgi:hypothetical protein